MVRRPSALVLFVLSLGSTVLLRGQAPLGPFPPPGEVTRLDAAAADKAAADAARTMRPELPAGVELSLWAPKALLVDPVAIDVAPDGTVYVSSTTRNNLPIDIRAHQDWMATVHTLRSVDDLRRFYAREMAPANSARNGWIGDLNGDGSRDLHDMAEMKERLFRLRDTDGDGRADESVVVYEGFNDDPTWDIFGGVLAHGRDVIAGVPPGVYRLRDTDGDGVFDQRTPIAEGFNTHPAFGGHGVSGVIVGPDGRLYWEVGDIGLHTTDKEGRTWSYPNQGLVARSELDGSGFEVFATGIRNLQEFAFDDRGHLVSVDNDGDHAGERERLVYLPYGSDSGWRSNWQYGKYTDPNNNRYNVWMRESLFKPRHAGQAAHILPPIENWYAVPAGFVFNPGTALSDRWKDYFFAASFPSVAANARVYGFKLAPDGAGFRKVDEQVLTRGVLVVGMKFGPDGALYLTDWVAGWDSKNDGRIWKLDTPAAAGTAMRKEVQALLRTDFATLPGATVARHLRHADMRVRMQAQFDLVRRTDVEALLFAARDRSHLHARLHGLWGLAQLARRDRTQASHLPAFLRDSDAELRAQAARMIGDIRYAAAADPLLPLLRDQDARVRFFAAEALGRLAHRPATAPIVAMLADNDGRDAYLQHTGAAALASIGDGDALAALSTHPSVGVRTAAVIALRRLKHAGVSRFLADDVEAIVTDAARAINDDGGIPAAVPALAALLGRPAFDNEPLLRRAINANLRLGTPEAVARLEAFAADATRPSELRVEAVATLGVWAAPSPMDRVDGIYHGDVTVSPGGGQSPRAAARGDRQPAIVLAAFSQTPARRPARPQAGGTRARDAAAARAAVERLVRAAAAPDATADSDVQVALAEAAGKLEATAVAPVLRAQLASAEAVSVRTASLRALQALGVGDQRALMETALADKDPLVRRAALGVLPKLAITPAAKTAYLSRMIADGTRVEQQGAFEVLGAIKSGESRKALAGYFDALEAGSLATSLHIDLVSAIQADGSRSLTRRLDEYQRKQQADALIKAFRAAALEGGDARRGQQVFGQNPLAECTRCHAIRGRGADVGPELTRIGRTLTREQILEALTEPNARIAPGYGTVSLTLKDGTSVGGTLREETDTELVIAAAAGEEPRRVPKAAIAERSDPVSGMPPLGLVLTPRDVRDLVEFLSALR